MKRLLSNKYTVALAVLFLIALVGTGTAGSIVQSAYNLVQNEGSNLPRQTTLNFTGAGVNCADASTKTTCDISGGAGGGGTPNYVQAFTAQTTVVLTHNLATTAIEVQCFDNTSPPLFVEFDTLEVTDANDATVTFSIAQTGYCVVNGTQGSGVNVSAENMDFTFSSAQNTVLCDASGGDVVGTLPTAVGISGRQYTFKKIDSSGNDCTMAGDGSETVDGAATQTTTTQWVSITVVSDGSDWDLVGSAPQGTGGGCTNGAWTALTFTGGVLQNFGGGFQVGEFQLDCTDRVHLRGLVTCAMTGTINTATTIVTLPMGNRPPADLIMGTEIENTGLMGMQITTGGVLTLRSSWACVSSVNFLSLESLTFSID